MCRKFQGQISSQNSNSSHFPHLNCDLGHVVKAFRVGDVVDDHDPHRTPVQEVQVDFTTEVRAFWGLMCKMFRLNGLSVYYRETE